MIDFDMIVFTIGVILWFIYVIWSLKKGVNPNMGRRERRERSKGGKIKQCLY